MTVVWPWRRRRRSAPVPARGAPAWRDAPPVRVTIGAHPVVLAPDGMLAAHRDPRFLAPLTHRSPSGPVPLLGDRPIALAGAPPVEVVPARVRPAPAAVLPLAVRPAEPSRAPAGPAATMSPVASTVWSAAPPMWSPSSPVPAPPVAPVAPVAVAVPVERVVARPPETAPVVVHAPGPDPDELVARLFDPLLRRMNAEMRAERDRRGTPGRT